MPALARGQASGCATPVLVLLTIYDDDTLNRQGVLRDSDVAEFVVELDGVQIFPVSGRESIDTEHDCPTGHRLGEGRYVIPYSVSSTAKISDGYEIVAYYKETATSAEQSYRIGFEVLSEVADPLLPRYCTAKSLRDEGITYNDADDLRLSWLVALASSYVERYTARFFEPRGKRIRLNGRGKSLLRLQEPIIAIGTVAIESGFTPTAEIIADVDSFRAYNRHLTQNLRLPDDRNAPLIEFVHVRRGADALPIFPRGQQNVRIDGVFGYTDPDPLGSPVGKTPELIALATRLLALRNVPKLTDIDERRRSQRAWRVVEEKAGDSGYRLGNWERGAVVGAFSGDPEIDNILAQFHRPPTWRAA